MFKSCQVNHKSTLPTVVTILVKKSGFLKNMNDFDRCIQHGSRCSWLSFPTSLARFYPSPCLLCLHLSQPCHSPQQTLRFFCRKSFLDCAGTPPKSGKWPPIAGPHGGSFFVVSGFLSVIKPRKGNIYGIWLFCCQVDSLANWHGWSCKAKTTSTNDGKSIVKDHSKHTRLVLFFLYVNLAGSTQS